MWSCGDAGKTGETPGSGRRRPGLRCDQPLADGVAHQARDVVHVELLHHARAVKLGRLEGDPEQRSDLLGGLAFRHELHDLTLPRGEATALRSEEHTSELQSQSNLVCRLLLEKKKKKDQHLETCYTPVHNTPLVQRADLE